MRCARLLALAACAACVPDDSREPAHDDGVGALRELVLDTEFLLEPSVEPREILEAKGGGLCVLDADRDGVLDLFVPGAGTLEDPRGQGARLFLGDGRLGYRDASEETGLAWRGWGMGTGLGDVDADGFDDVFVAAWGRDALLFGGAGGALRERGSGTGCEHDGWSSGAVFADLDRDGDLDLAVARYLRFDPSEPPPETEFFGIAVFGGPAGMPAEPNGLYENRGDGTFASREDAPGFGGLEPRASLGVLACDLDQDGWQDLFVGNDSQPNRLHLGSGTWSFEEQGERSGLARSADGHGQATMGIALADVNGDLLPDLFTTNFARDTNTLHLSVGPRRWRDATKAWGLAAGGHAEVGWGAAFCDLDDDGDQDLVVANGHVYADRLARELGSARAQGLHWWRRDGDRFRLAAEDEQPGLGARAPWRGLVACDLDGDLDTDLAATALGEAPRLFENLGVGDAVAVDLDWRDVPNVRGIGARLVLRADASVHTRWVQRGGSYQASGPATVTFPACPAGSRLSIEWPDGWSDELELPATSGAVRVVREERRTAVER